MAGRDNKTITLLFVRLLGFFTGRVISIRWFVVNSTVTLESSENTENLCIEKSFRM